MMRPTRHGVLRASQLVISVLATAWLALVTIYFLRSNLPLIHNEQQPFGVFSGLFGAWSFSLANTPPVALLCAVIHALLTAVFGALVLLNCRVRATLAAFLALSFTVGFGLSGVAFVLLTMAHGLHTPLVWLGWIVMIAVLVIAGRRRGCLCWRDAIVRDDAGESLGMRVLWWCAATIVALITAATFWHALFFPETYWDSLILYLGYGRMTFLQHAFPFKAEAQVGIGLGANYPHLYSNYCAVASTMFGQWNDLHARLAAPLAGLGATVLTYETTRLLWKNRLHAIMVALLFRALPNGIAYSTYASDYAFAILFAAAFLCCIAMYAKTGGRGWLLLTALMPGIAMNLNYLMGVLWPVWLVAILLVNHLRGRAAVVLLRDRFLWVAFACGLVVGAPWYVRNTVLTNNPVYSFFPQVFTGSVRTNRDVLASANLEWFRNGDGIGRVAEFMHDFRTGGPERDVNSDAFTREATLGDRVASSFLYWVGFETVRFTDSGGGLTVGLWRDRLVHLLKLFSADPMQSRRESASLSILRWQHSYKMMVLFPALLGPSMLLLALMGLSRAGALRNRGEDFVARATTMAAAALLVMGLLAYEYLLADFYLYQIIAVIVPAAIIASVLFHVISRHARLSRMILPVVYGLVLVQGIAPGLAFALMGFKFTGAQVLHGELFAQTNLAALRHAGMSSAEFYRLQYGADPDMWDFVNRNLKNQAILTHENRHYVFDPSITFIHLDDWEMQQGYDLPTAQATMDFLKAHGLRYYLRTRNEANHKITMRLHMDRVIDGSHARELFRAGDNVLYELEPATGGP
ncbi:glycosyltransferase family 39 protein [Candidatus Sumerlaeota bacterium]|nr:glycosyltransferase family 39 protein [Candidatus Sumerlaeota bacterium]